MRQRIIRTMAFGATRAAASRPARRASVSLALLLALVASVLGGCVVVPLGGWGYDGHHGGGYYHHRW